MNMFAPQSKVQKTTVSFEHVGMTLPNEMVGDQIRLKQVLINLVKNAFKFTYEGTIVIKAAYDY